MTELKLRILFDDAMLGPGKAALVERIRETGSISAAGRGMGMSYKRAWLLVEEMNGAFTLPQIQSARGGPGGGGAHLTEAGEEGLTRCRRVVEAARSAAREDIAALEVLIAHGRGAARLAISEELDLVGLPGGGKLAMALVDAVPAGQYGKAALEALGLWEGVAPSVAQADNVRPALAQV